MTISIEEKLSVCTKCKKSTIHHRNSESLGVIMIIIHIILTIITSGLWIIPLVIYLLFKAGNKNKFVCKECGCISMHK